MANRTFTQEEYDTVLTPSQVELQNIQLVIHPLVNDLEYSWAFPSDPAVVTVDLSLIQSDPLLARHLPDELPTYDRAVSYHDKGDEANIRIKIVALKDYKLIPFCVPRVTKISLGKNYSNLSIANPDGVSLFDFVKKFSKMFEHQEDGHVFFEGVKFISAGSVTTYVHAGS